MNTIKRLQFWIIVGLLLLPILARTLWYYRSLPQVAEVSTPDYPSFTLPQPPISTPLPAGKPAEPNRTVVLIDQAHSNQFQADEIQPLLEAIDATGAQVEFLQGDPPLYYRLRYADALVIIAPSSGFTTTEAADIQEFVSSGGRLLVITDATRGLLTYDWYTGAQYYLPDANLVNPLLAPYGLNVTDDYLYNLNDNEGNFRNVFFRSFGQDALTENLSQVVLYGSHSITTNGGTPLLLGDRGTLSSLTDLGGELAGAALSANGQVLAIGDLTFLSTPYAQVADNQVLIANLAGFLTAGGREPSLFNYPFVFNSDTVNVIATGDVQWNANLLNPLALMQYTFRQAGIDLQPVSADNGGDRLILGTFDYSEELAAYVAPFGLDLEQITDSIDLPGIGLVGRSGNGLLLYQNTPEGALLILLADTSDDLITFLSFLSSTELPSGCLIEADRAVCSSGYGESFGENGGMDEGAGDGELPTPTPVVP